MWLTDRVSAITVVDSISMFVDPCRTSQFLPRIMGKSVVAGYGAKLS
jgi:hypothetical protein